MVSGLELSVWHWLLLGVTGAAAGLVDSIAGGGGLLTVPVLLGVGISPAAALGTNKLQASFGSATAAWNYQRAGLMALGASADGVLWTAVGSAVGAMGVGWVSDAWLRRAIPWLLMAALALLVLRPHVAERPRKPVLGTRWFHGGVGLALGAYDGFFGPGVGALWTLAFLGLRGMEWVRATAHTKLMNCTSNVVALAVFSSQGVVCVGPGIVMGLGQWVGARLGARLVISRGARFVRPVFLCMVAAVCLKLVWPSG